MAQYDRLNGGAATARRWQDWVNLVLGVWLFISPWVLNFAAGYATGAAPGGAAAGATAPAGDALANASWDAWIFGVVIAVVALSSTLRVAAWQEWGTLILGLILGVWLFIAPWALAFSGAPAAAWDHWIVGALVFLVSLSALPYFRRAAMDYAHAGDKPLDRP